MALAAHFAKDASAAAHVLQGFDDDTFRRRLNGGTIAVAFDASTARSREGRTALELTVDLLARLYPILAFVPLDRETVTIDLIETSRAHARRVNARIDRDGKLRKASFLLVFGTTSVEFDRPALHVGSDGWTAKLDAHVPVGSGASDNPFGAAAAACLAAANVFRSVFSDQIADPRLDERLSFDVLACSHGDGTASAPLPGTMDIGEVHLAGVGAIGRAACWTLARVAGLAGTLHLVDGESVDETNPQRYIGTTGRDLHRSKVDGAAAMFTQPGLRVVGHGMTWGEYLAGRDEKRIERVAVALDTAHGRMAVQAGLPRRLLNAWTQVGDLGVSRHGFDDGPCAMCLYLPDGEGLSEAALVAQAVGLPEPEARAMLFAGTPVDRSVGERIAAARGIDFEEIRRFVGEPLRSFYAKAVCGTTVFGSPEPGSRGAFAAPMAFQSAMAGLLLAVEIIADATASRAHVPPATTRMDLLRPLGRVLHVPAAKDATGNCICRDVDYLDAYRRKYRAAQPTATPRTAGGGGVPEHAVAGSA